MKRMFLSLFLLILFSSCKDITEVYYIDGSNYFELNGERYIISLTSSEVYYPTSLNADTENNAYNHVTVNLDDKYSIYFDDEEYYSGQDYELRLDELSSDNYVKITLLNNNSGESTISYIKTWPKDLTLGQMTIDTSLQYGYYYYSCNNYLIKLKTDGSLVFFYKKSNDTATAFTRTVIDDVIYYSYQENVAYNDYPKLSGVGYTTRKGVVFDKNYQIIDNVNYLEGWNGHPLENHHFEIIGHRHYTVSAYVGQTKTDIPNHEGESVNVVAAVVQEIKDGALEFEWISTDYPELYEYSDKEYDPTATWVDYCHFNSLAIDPADGNWVMSFRQLSSIIKIDRANNTGNIMWILSGDGEGGSFEVTTTDMHKFRRQHDIKFTNNNQFTFFSNNSSSTYDDGSDITAAVMKFTIDDQTNPDAPTITAFSRFDGDYASSSMGSAQELYETEGHYLIAWGGGVQGAQFTEKDFNSNKVLFEITEVDSSNAYRAYKYEL